MREVSCLLTLLAFLPADGAASIFGYQLHSYNDFRQWPVIQARSKVYPGFVRLKVDPHFVSDTTFCARHGFGTPDCLVFSHDDPDMRETYNTSLQLGAGLRNFPSATIALCAKYTENEDPCNNPSFLKLVDDMIRSITPVVSSLNITLIIDGALTPTNRTCMQSRYPPWRSTFIGTEDPMQAATSNVGYFADYQINNMKCCAENVEAMAKLTPPYGKFSSNLLFPFQLWEPENQSVIQTVAEAFTRSQYGSQKLLFAINQDALQLQNYLTASPVLSTTRATLVAVGNAANGSLFFTPEADGWGGCFLFPTGPGYNYQLFEVCGTNVAGYDAAGDAVVVTDKQCSRITTRVPVQGKRLVALQCSVSDPSSFVYITDSGEVVALDGTSLSLGLTMTAVTSGFTLLPYLDATFLGVSNKTIIVRGGGRSAFIGVGSSVRGALLGDKATGSLFLVTGGAYCFNCETHNKRPTPRVCDQFPESTVNVLSYTVGSVPSIVDAAFAGTNTTFLMHACSSKNLHNSFGVGRRAAPFLISGGTFNITYEPIAEYTECPVACGCPTPDASDEAPMRSFAVPLR
ncbi:hypothetical protein DIPPA_29501 [Diplonema papillatum]|nr:hypothetical protein DIPPA_29501 [Diplonema papillatum]